MELHDLDKKDFLNQIDLFVLDMDGTFYLGDIILEGSLEFLKKVEEAGKHYIFFTNNSSKSPENYIQKLAKMNCHIGRDQIMTSGDVTIEFLKRNRAGQSVYLVGTPALVESFEEAGVPLVIENPDIVVIGFDTTLTYEKLERACTFIRNGAEFLATHLDINCPTEDGFIPDCGAMCALISLSTAKEPKYLGKPFRETMEMVLAKTGFEKEKVAFVGDRIYTDVATGVKNGAKGILVLSGETKAEDIAQSDVKPDAVFASIGEMAEYL
ncbi:MAG: HAD-IIA family hydrolase [Roseburia sp.]|nr:HAD-IIA family hydrolase [Roseburia sp.]